MIKSILKVTISSILILTVSTPMAYAGCDGCGADAREERQQRKARKSNVKVVNKTSNRSRGNVRITKSPKFSEAKLSNYEKYRRQRAKDSKEVTERFIKDVAAPTGEAVVRILTVPRDPGSVVVDIIIGDRIGPEIGVDGPSPDLR